MTDDREKPYPLEMPPCAAHPFSPIASRVARRQRALVALLGALAAACGTTRDPPDRLSVDAVESRDDSHVALAITGADFPVGAHGEVRLEGAWYGALQASERRAMNLPCTINGAGDAIVARDAFASLEVPGVFEGQVSLQLESSGDRPVTVAGPVDATFAVDGENKVAAARVALQRQMHTARNSLGVAVELRPGAGLRVTHLEPGGRAAQAGIREGDLLTRLDTRPLLLESALAFRDDGSDSSVGYVRNGTQRTARVTLGDARRAADDTGAQLWVCLLFACGGAFLPGRLAAGACPRERASTLALWLSVALAAVLIPLASGNAALLLLVLALLPAALCIRAAGSRQDALHALAHTACSTIAFVACVLHARGVPAEGEPITLLRAPWLWLALWTLAWTPRHARIPMAAEVAGLAAAAALFTRAALWGDFAANSQLFSALLAACALLLLQQLQTYAAGDAALWARGAAGGVSLVCAWWSPTLGVIATPFSLVSLALLGVVSGHIARSLLTLRVNPRHRRLAAPSDVPLPAQT